MTENTRKDVKNPAERTDTVGEEETKKTGGAASERESERRRKETCDDIGGERFPEQCPPAEQLD